MTQSAQIQFQKSVTVHVEAADGHHAANETYRPVQMTRTTRTPNWEGCFFMYSLNVMGSNTTFL